MSEQDRARLYDWLSGQAGEQLAEYLMSCIASAPLTELATKDSVERLETTMATLATKDSVERLETTMATLATKDSVERLEATVATLATKDSVDRLEALFEADRVEARAERQALRRGQKRLVFALPVEIFVALGAVAAITEWLHG